MTETSISAVSEIEARYERAEAKYLAITQGKEWWRETETPTSVIGDSLEDIPALCATVKRLRAENERLLRGDFTDQELQGFCHNLSEQDQRAFFEGCTKYQQRLFGTSVAEQVREEIK